MQSCVRSLACRDRCGGLLWRFEGRIHIRLTGSLAAVCLGFPVNDLVIIVLRDLASLTQSCRYPSMPFRRRLECRTLFLGHHRPQPSRHTVGKIDSDNHAWLSLQHIGEPWIIARTFLLARSDDRHPVGEGALVGRTSAARKTLKVRAKIGPQNRSIFVSTLLLYSP